VFSRIRYRINDDFLLLSTLLIVSIGCEDDRLTTGRSRRIDNQVVDSVEKRNAPQTTAKPRDRETRITNQINKPRPTSEKPPANPQTEKSDQLEDSTKKERNLETELQSLIGNPIDCLSPQAGGQAPDTIELALEAYVTANGIVSRSSVRSPYLSNIELTCVKKRIENGRFRAPIDDAPRAIRTTVTLRQVTPPSPKLR
jgi:hypothetical protein